MFASHQTSPSNRPRRPHPLHPRHCHPACPACPACPERSRRERSRRERSEGSAFLSPVAPRRSPLAIAPLTPFLVYPEPRRVHPEPRRATLDAASQLTENPATLSPLPATLTRRVKPNPLVCRSYKKHPGVGVSRHTFPLSNSSILCAISALSVPSTLKSPFKTTTVPPLQQKPLPRALFSLFPKIRQRLNPDFSSSSTLFQKDCSHNSFPINSFRTLLQNTGGHIFQIRISSFHFRISFFPPPNRYLLTSSPLLCAPSAYSAPLRYLFSSRITGHGSRNTLIQNPWNKLPSPTSSQVRR
jgi:hypothetical protein